MQFAIHVCCGIAHLLAGAAWFGAMFYNLTVLHPKARRFFGDNERYEEFIASISQGARWKVLGGLGLIAVTGVGMLICVPAFFREHHSALSKWAIILHIALWPTAIGIFWYVSWRLWPRRIFATADELPALRRRFMVAGMTLMIIAASAMALGLLAQAIS